MMIPGSGPRDMGRDLDLGEGEDCRRGSESKDGYVERPMFQRCADTSAES
jgi:hypothetical protein